MSETISDTETLSNEENGGTFKGASAAGWQLRDASKADRMSVTFLQKWSLKWPTNSCKDPWRGNLVYHFLETRQDEQFLCDH
jgi:hypothetical protein